MNILFLSIGDIPSIRHREIYPDLLREFIKNGHRIYVVCSREKRKNAPTELVEEDGAVLLKVKIGNITKTNLIEKGISTVLVNNQYKAAIKKYFSNIKFDMVMYSTPPITLVGCIEYVKKRDAAKTYLLLKDIFPQNAVDLGMMTESGVKSFIYKYFRSKEKKMYAVSDRIGCMSQANVDYVIKHNSDINPEIVEVCPNSIEVVDKKVFVYGGNLGKPQGIDFMIKCLKSQQNNKDVFFLIVGDGTEFGKIEEYVNADKPSNIKLMKRLPKEDYDKMVGACDVGMIFLDHRFTIPNFPSRLLAYMQAGLPVLACTDPNTDIGSVIVGGGFGWWCESNHVSTFAEYVDKISFTSNLKEMGLNGKKYLDDHYSVCYSVKIIERSACK